MPRDIEQKAMKLVMAYEQKEGRIPKDVSRTRCGYDLKSGDRCIEVKGQSSIKPEFIYLYKKTLQNLQDDILHYYIYIVYDIRSEDPKLRILPPEKVFGNMEIEPQFLIRAKTFKGLEDIHLNGKLE